MRKQGRVDENSPRHAVEADEEEEEDRAETGKEKGRRRGGDKDMRERWRPGRKRRRW